LESVGATALWSAEVEKERNGEMFLVYSGCRKHISIKAVMLFSARHVGERERFKIAISNHLKWLRPRSHPKDILSLLTEMELSFCRKIIRMYTL
jgi:hypothetical protein